MCLTFLVVVCFLFPPPPPSSFFSLPSFLLPLPPFPMPSLSLPPLSLSLPSSSLFLPSQCPPSPFLLYWLSIFLFSIPFPSLSYLPSRFCSSLSVLVNNKWFIIEYAVSSDDIFQLDHPPGKT